MQEGNEELSLANVETILGRRLEEQRRQTETLAKLGLDKSTFEGRNKVREMMDLHPLTREEWEEDQKHHDGAWESDSDGSSEYLTLGPGETPKDFKCACGKKHDSLDPEEPKQETLDRWANEHKLSLCDFLSDMSGSLRDEELDIEFEYFASHRSTWRLLEATQQACLPPLLPFVDEWKVDVLQSDEGTTGIPGLIMLGACDPRQNINIVPLKSSINVDE